MILNEKVKDVVVLGEDNSKKAKISENKLAKLQYLLTKGLYKDPITAVIAEWTNNGIDSIVQAGKDPIESPVLVKIEKDKNNHYIFSVEDKGIGLDNHEFEDICMNYLESTKESDNDTIGHFGIGMKSFLSLERPATFTCIKNGIKRVYLVYEGAEFVNYTLVTEEPTDQENGVTAQLTIKDYNEVQLFITKASSKLTYYDTAVLIIHGNVNSNKIYRNELFQYSISGLSNQMHISLKDVYYPIDWEALGIPPIDFPVAIRLSLSDGLTPTPSRESYITNQKTKDMLMKKIEDIANWFVEKYNQDVKVFDNLRQAYPYIGESQFFVNLTDKRFLINPILKYSTKKISEASVKGVSLISLQRYKIIIPDLLYGYDIVSYLDASGTMKTRRVHGTLESYAFAQNKTVVIVDTSIRGHIREYLKDKYSSQTLFIRKNGFHLPLLTKNANKSLQTSLALNTFKKDLWRSIVEEKDLVISGIERTFIDESDIESKQDFLDWKEERKKNLKKKVSSSSYQGIGKQKGDVTLAYSYLRYNKIHFKKEAYPIDTLTENRFLTVLATKDDDLENFKMIAHVNRAKHVKFALVGKLEIKKIPDYYQFINFNTFMEKSKVFKRMASAALFSELLSDVDEITSFQAGLLGSEFARLKDDISTLRKYVSSNIGDLNSYTSNKIKPIFIDTAIDNDLFDKSIWDIYLRVKEQVKKYDFLVVLHQPHNYDKDKQKMYTRFVYQMFLFRKKYYGDVSDDIIEKVKV